MARHLDTGPRYTPRLVLRPFRRRDVGALDTAVRASLTDLQPWLPWAQPGYDRGVAQRFVKDSMAAWHEGKAFDFAIRLRDDLDRHVGNVSVWHVSQQNAVGEVGYWIRSDEMGNGLGTEATARVLRVAYEELGCHKVVLRIAVGNASSERLAEKLGFLQEGLLRDEVKIGDTWVDHTVWSLLDREWVVEQGRYTVEGWT